MSHPAALLPLAASVSARSPGSPGAGIDVENTAAVVLQAADPAQARKERQHPAVTAADAEIHRIPGQMIRARRAADAAVMARAAAGRVHGERAEIRGHLRQNVPERAREASGRGNPSDRAAGSRKRLAFGRTRRPRGRTQARQPHPRRLRLGLWCASGPAVGPGAFHHRRLGGPGTGAETCDRQCDRTGLRAPAARGWPGHPEGELGGRESGLHLAGRIEQERVCRQHAALVQRGRWLWRDGASNTCAGVTRGTRRWHSKSHGMSAPHSHAHTPAIGRAFHTPRRRHAPCGTARWPMTARDPGPTRDSITALFGARRPREAGRVVVPVRFLDLARRSG